MNVAVATELNSMLKLRIAGHYNLIGCTKINTRQMWSVKDGQSGILKVLMSFLFKQYFKKDGSVHPA